MTVRQLRELDRLSRLAARARWVSKCAAIVLGSWLASESLAQEGDQPAKQSTPDQVAQEEPKSADDSTEKLGAEANQAAEKPEQKPTEKPKPDSSQENAEKPAKEPKEKTAQESTEKPSESPAEKPAAKPNEKSDDSKASEAKSKPGQEKANNKGDGDSTPDDAKKPAEDPESAFKPLLEELDELLEADKLEQAELTHALKLLSQLAIIAPVETVCDYRDKVKIKGSGGAELEMELGVIDRVVRFRELLAVPEPSEEQTALGVKTVTELLRSAPGTFAVQRYLAANKPIVALGALLDKVKSDSPDDKAIDRSLKSLDSIGQLRALSAQKLNGDEAQKAELLASRIVLTDEVGVAADVAAKLLADLAAVAPETSSVQLTSLANLSSLRNLSEQAELTAAQQAEVLTLSDALFIASEDSRELTRQLTSCLESIFAAKIFSERRDNLRIKTYIGLLGQRVRKPAISASSVVLTNGETRQGADLRYKLPGDDKWRILGAGQSRSLRLFDRIEVEIFTGVSSKLLTYQTPGTVTLRVVRQSGKPLWRAEFEEAAASTTDKLKPMGNEGSLLPSWRGNSFVFWEPLSLTFPVAFLQDAGAESKEFMPPRAEDKSQAAVPAEIESSPQEKREWESDVSVVYRGPQDNVEKYFDSIGGALNLAEASVNLAQRLSEATSPNEVRIKELLTLNEMFHALADGFRGLVEKERENLSLGDRDERRLQEVAKNKPLFKRFRDAILKGLSRKIPEDFVSTMDADQLRRELQDHTYRLSNLQSILQDTGRRLAYYDNKELYELERRVSRGRFGRCHEYCCYVRVAKPDGSMVDVQFAPMPPAAPAEAPSLPTAPSRSFDDFPAPPPPDDDLPAPPLADGTDRKLDSIAVIPTVSPLDAAIRQIESGFREWVDASGEFRRTAHLLSISDGKVRLLQRDGTRSVIELEKLSRHDQTLLAYWEVSQPRTWTDQSGARTVVARLISMEGERLQFLTDAGVQRSITLDRLSTNDQQLLGRLLTIDDTNPIFQVVER
ncbi:MAG: SHD1 domain-containing protein [Pirellulales bacterium]